MGDALLVRVIGAFEITWTGDVMGKITFSNSLIIQQVITKEIINVTVVWKSDLN